MPTTVHASAYGLERRQDRGLLRQDQAAEAAGALAAAVSTALCFRRSKQEILNAVRTPEILKVALQGFVSYFMSCLTRLVVHRQFRRGDWRAKEF